ncbi:MAG TPA: GvpL/GvpF family gas vesicle protein [Vicinamibacterales bacterium]|jgi:hypothetical protein|nr:GvpL/GvpF family gas vesicle protein [Vicinamibacterales bacterium]
MSVGVYAITGSRLIPETPGVRLRAVRVGALTALVSDVRRSPAPIAANLRRYHRAIAAIADAVPAVLPVRFGTVMTESELAIVLHSRARTFRSALAHVRGKAQMTVRLVTGNRGRRPLASPPVKSVASGTAYLQSRAAGAREIEGFAPVRAALARWIRDERVERNGAIVSVYHLVPRRSSSAYAGAAERTLAAAGLRAVVSGPFPPYAFSSW